MKNLTRILCTLLTLAVMGVSQAQAHFVWVEVVTADGGKQLVRVAFSEAGEPGAAYLVDRIAHAKAMSHAAKVSQLQLKPSLTEEETGWLVAELDQSTPRVQLDCKYGIFSRGEEPSLLHYYASYENLARGEAPQNSAELLALQIRPSGNAEELQLTVLWQGKPVSGSEVVVISPDGKETSATSNDQGQVLVSKPAAGTYRIRARHVVDQPGTDNGESYAEELHYSTLTLDFAKAADAEKANSGAELTAAQLLAGARNGRAIWEDFPGFSAEMTVYEFGRKQTGTIAVDSYGILTIDDIEFADNSRVESSLRSLISHRMGNGEADDRVSYADDETEHPLGRLLTLDYDSAMGSAYRVQGDVIREVNRNSDRGHFTITVFDVYRNPQGKYLPSSYVVHSWDKDEALRGSTVVRDSWVRVGEFDLPESHTAVTAGPEQHDDMRIEFRNHQLQE